MHDLAPQLSFLHVSISYLLPLLQDLKNSNLDNRGPPIRSHAIKPCVVVLVPMHNLAPQLSSFLKSFLHVSISYLLPLLQDLKNSNLDNRGPPTRSHAIKPCVVVLVPMHELAPQLSSFMKSFLHVSNLRRENVERAAQLGMDVYRTDKMRLF